MTTVRGHCFCGAVKFFVRGPEAFACICYCESCQRAAGAPAVAWATYARSTFTISEGEPSYYESSPGVIRGHCSTCASCISYETAKRPDDIDITLNTLDDPASVIVRAHIWTEDKQPWTAINDALPIYAKSAG